MFDILSISCEIPLSWMPQDFMDDLSVSSSGNSLLPDGSGDPHLCCHIVMMILFTTRVEGSQEIKPYLARWI